MAYLEESYTLVLNDTSDVPTVQQLQQQLEKGNDESKCETMRRILMIMLNGDPLNQLLMHIIRFVMPSKSKPLKKLLYFYYEICPKLDQNGKLKQEMILVCNGIRNDLQHPNEYIRGATLRFLCKLKEPELLEPLLSSLRNCLEHRHAYVRKNAVLAVQSVFKTAEHLIPDAPELLLTFLGAESDHTCKRNAFVALNLISHEKALEYLSQHFDEVAHADELTQLALIEFIRKDAVQNQAARSRYLKLIFDLLEASSNTVVYEAASTLTALTSNAVAVKAAASKFVELAIKEADNNVKLIVLERIDKLRKQHAGVLDSLTMDVLRVLSSPDIDVRRKTLKLAMDMVSSKNVEEVVTLLKKELQKSLNEEYEKNNEYRQIIIQAIHNCAIRFSEVAQNVVGLLIDFISEFSSTVAVDVLAFVKEVVEKYPPLRSSVIEKLTIAMESIRSGKVMRNALWIVGEYSETQRDIQTTWKAIRASLGEIPILASEERLLKAQTEGIPEEAEGTDKPKASGGAPRVNADGTYATESAITQSSAKAALEAVQATQKPPLRQLVLDGDFYMATVLSTALAKLVLRYSKISDDEKRINALQTEAMLMIVSIIRVGQSDFVKSKIDNDSKDRLMQNVRILNDFKKVPEYYKILLEDSRKAYQAIVAEEDKKRKEKDDAERSKNAIQVDDVLNIRQFAKKGAVENITDVDDLAKAVAGDVTEDMSSKLSRVVPLTGFSDPVYAEVYVKVHQFDIILDVLLVNQTADTLQNLSVEFATLGDLKVIERPQSFNLGPHAFQSVQSTIKVSSTDTGVIFGNLVYDGASSTETNVVILNDLHVDIMDYIHPAQCTETQFRQMWTEFEWENKVNISHNGGCKTLSEFLKRLMSVTNMANLTPNKSLSEDCQFLSANLYAKTVFGEDALANVSLEQLEPQGAISGFIRIRSRSQGLALSLGSLKGLNGGKVE